MTLSRSNPRAKPRWALLVAGLASMMLLATAVLGLVSDGTAADQCDIQVASSATSDICTTDAGAIVEYIGSSASNQSSGTGIFDPFVRLQASPAESGYNTNGTLQFDSKAGKWTHAILVSAIPVVNVGGVSYWELFVDINEGNSSKQISLNEMEIWFTTNPLLTGYVDPSGFPQASGATLQYDFSGEILINDVNQGSGRGDLRYLVPLTGITMPPAGTYFVLYSEWGGTTAGPNFISDGGFEEWKVRKVATPSIATTPSTGGVIGTVLNDTATVSGGSSPTGSVTFNLWGPNDVGCDGTPVYTQTVALVAGVATTTPGYTTLAAGVYAWTASYNGDSNNSSAFSGCTAEEVTITPSSPTLPTTPSAGGAIGTVLNDTATVTGGTNPTGTVTFNLWGPDDVDCDGTAVYTQTVGLTAGSATTTPGYTTLAAGTYAWTATYSGDPNNNTASSGCTEEEVVIGKNSPSASTAQDLIPNDTLSLSGATSDAGGTVDFYLFAPDVTCSLANIANAAYTEEDVALTGDDDASTSNTGSGEGMFLATAEGTYTWLAIYSGDANNAPATSDCVEEFTIDNDTTPTP